MLTVGSIMSREVITVAPDAPLSSARGLLDAYRMHHLPVVEHGRLIGVVSERDLSERPAATRGGKKRAEPTVRDRMSASPEIVSPDESVARASRRMLERRVSCLPVVERGRVAGMLTEFDLLRAYERACRNVGDAAFDPAVEVRASGELVVVGPDERAVDALERCRIEGIRHLPVLRDGWVVGVVSDRDLLPAVERPGGAEEPVGELMTRDFVAVEPGTPLSAAAGCMVANGFHSLPVLENAVLRGIATSADVLAALSAIDEQVLAAAWSRGAARRANVEEC